MIQDRRNLSEALACEYQGGHTETMRDNFIITQNSIEAIDRTIAHETVMARENAGIDSRSRPVRSLWSRAARKFNQI